MKTEEVFNNGEEAFYRVTMDYSELIEKWKKEEMDSNYIKIMQEDGPLIGKLYEYGNRKKFVYRFKGILTTNEDYYYMMEPLDEHSKPRYLSCVGSIEQWGFRRIDE